MNVLSLFDGISCGQLALKRLGAKVDNYYASEIDKHAIQVTMNNFPSTKQLGDVREVKGLEGIDLLLGGSPCQGFSFNGKKLNFEDERSKLFFEFVRIKNEINPKWFLLENVMMNKESQNVISELLGVQPILINSSLVSAQNRKRLYWTNINFELPDDKGIVLKDILDPIKSFEGSYQERTNKRRKSLCLNVGVADLATIFEQNKRVYDIWHKSPTITTKYSQKYGIRIAVDGEHWRKLTINEVERLQTLPDDYTKGIDENKRGFAIGNGWTVDIICSILKEIVNKED